MGKKYCVFSPLFVWLLWINILVNYEYLLAVLLYIVYERIAKYVFLQNGMKPIQIGPCSIFFCHAAFVIWDSIPNIQSDRKIHYKLQKKGNHYMFQCLKAHLANYSWKVVFDGERKKNRFTSLDDITREKWKQYHRWMPSLSKIREAKWKKRKIFGWCFRHWLITSKLHATSTRSPFSLRHQMFIFHVFLFLMQL